MPVGPILPATQTFRPALSASLRAILAAWKAISEAIWAHPYSDWLILLAEKELVSIISAPASMYARWILATLSGSLRLKLSLFPLRPAFWSMVPIAPSRIRIRLSNALNNWSAAIRNTP